MLCQWQNHRHGEIKLPFGGNLLFRNTSMKKKENILSHWNFGNYLLMAASIILIYQDAFGFIIFQKLYTVNQIYFFRTQTLSQKYLHLETHWKVYQLRITTVINKHRQEVRQVGLQASKKSLVSLCVGQCGKWEFILVEKWVRFEY